MLKPIYSHEGSVTLQHTFREAHQWLQSQLAAQFATARGNAYTATAGTSKGQEVICFFQRRRNGTEGEFGRVYACCWGHYYNCNHTRIGMYCVALDAAMR